MVGRYHSTNVITEWSSSLLTKAASQISIQQDVVHRGCCSYLHVPGYLQICRGWCLKTRSEGRLLRAVHPCFRSGCNQLKPEEQVGEPEERSEASFCISNDGDVVGRHWRKGKAFWYSLEQRPQRTQHPIRYLLSTKCGRVRESMRTAFIE